MVKLETDGKQCKKNIEDWDDPNSLSGSNLMGLGNNASKKYPLYSINIHRYPKKYPRSGMNKIVPLEVLCLNGAWS